MYVDIAQLQRGVHNYAEMEVAPKAEGLAKFAVYMAIPSVNTYIQKLTKSPILVDLVDGDRIELDELKDRAIDAMNHCATLEVAGFRFTRNDIDVLCDYIQRG